MVSSTRTSAHHVTFQNEEAVMTNHADDKFSVSTTQESNACGLSDPESSDALFSLESTVDLQALR